MNHSLLLDAEFDKCARDTIRDLRPVTLDTARRVKINIFYTRFNSTWNNVNDVDLSRNVLQFFYVKRFNLDSTSPTVRTLLRRNSPPFLSLPDRVLRSISHLFARDKAPSSVSRSWRIYPAAIASLSLFLFFFLPFSFFPNRTVHRNSGITSARSPNGRTTHVRGRVRICESRGGWKKIRAALSNYSSSRPRGGKEKRKLPGPLVSSRLILSSKEDSAGRQSWPRFGLTRTLRPPFFISFRSEICFFNSASEAKRSRTCRGKLAGTSFNLRV